MINFGDFSLRPAEVLAALFNAAKTQGMGILHYKPGHFMTEAEAELLLAGGNYFNYVEGRVLKVHITDGKVPDLRLYNRYNGEGAGYNAIIKAAHHNS